MIEQRSSEWLIQRLGYITASEFHNLMKSNRKKEPFSDATYTYLNRKVMERFIPREDGTAGEYVELHEVSNYAMKYGTQWEPVARDAYARLTGYDVMEVEFVELAGFEGLCGASADGIVRQEKGGCEIKCPYSIEHHLDYLLLKSPDELKELKPEYYWQMRLCMMAWDLDWYDFVAYCPYVSPSKQLKVLRMQRDTDADREMCSRLELAREYMMGKIRELGETATDIR